MEMSAGRGISGVEETSLEAVLDDFRKALDSDHGHVNAKYVKTTHLGELDDLILRHFRATQEPILSIRGRSLPLVYKIISTIVSPPHNMSVFVLDLDGRFDATRLACADSDLRHVYVQHPPDDSVTDNGRSHIAQAEEFMLYSRAARASLSRRWWGSIVVGGLGAGDLTAGCRGWLRVDREHVPGFVPDTSAEGAYRRRPALQDAVDACGWTATSPWGDFSFHDG